jgi:hypothetical protein
MTLMNTLNYWKNNLDYWLGNQETPTKISDPNSTALYELAYNSGRRDAYKEIIEILAKQGYK